MRYNHKRFNRGLNYDSHRNTMKPKVGIVVGDFNFHFYLQLFYFLFLLLIIIDDGDDDDGNCCPLDDRVTNRVVTFP